MKILHTSDWHLGQSLRGFERHYEHQCFLDWLLARIQADDIDVLLVSGDIFDNANPSAASQKQLYRFLHAARQVAPHLRVVMIAGNHDSPGRLEAPSPLLELFETRVVGQTRRDAQGNIDLDDLIVPLYDRHDRLRAWVLAIPFLRPGDVPRIDDEGDVYLMGVEALYQQTLAEILLRRQQDQAILALGHCHMSGGGVSQESERRIVVGGAEMLSDGIFDERIAYAALGHLHLPQAVAGKEWVRYSGSPLPMSFAEIHYPHQVVKIELDGERLKAVEPIPVPRAVELLRIPAQPQPLAEVLAALEALTLPNDDSPSERWPYLEVRVRFDAPEPGARAAIEQALKGKPLRFVGIDASYSRADDVSLIDSDDSLGDLSQMQPEAILQKHYLGQYGAALPADLMQAFQALLLEPVEDAS